MLLLLKNGDPASYRFPCFYFGQRLLLGYSDPPVAPLHVILSKCWIGSLEKKGLGVGQHGLCIKEKKAVF